MRALGLPVVEINMDLMRARGGASSEQVYSTIVSEFKDLVCYVYVRALPAIPDILLKRCAEYTLYHPWRYIFFENTDTTYNFSENRDRCSYSFFIRPTLDEVQFTQGSDSNQNMRILPISYTSRRLKAPQLDVATIEHLMPELNSEKMQLPPENRSDWAKVMSHIIYGSKDSAKVRFAMIFSPPGAGKTELLKNIREKYMHGWTCPTPLDCSSPLLTERSLDSILRDSWSGDYDKKLMVFDEYHMLNAEQKEQLFNFLEEKSTSEYLRVVLIGNRKDDFDDKIPNLGVWQSCKRLALTLDAPMGSPLNTSRGSPLNTSRGSPLNTSRNGPLDGSPRLTTRSFDSIVGRLSIDDVINFKFTEKNTQQERDFVIMWHRAARALFSDEAISLRNVHPLVAIFNRTEEVREVAFGNLLLAKMPALGEFACREFATQLLVIFSSGHLRQHDAISNPMRLLIQAALAPGHNDVVSYPEFVTRLSAAQEIHPCLRLAAWIHKTYSDCGKSTPSLRPLEQLVLIDQVGFPLVMGISSGGASLTSCNSFVRQGDYSDLKWLTETVMRGYAIDWSKARKMWMSNFVTSVEEYEKLLAACPDPKSCLSALTPTNLCDLLQQSFRGKLPSAVLEHTRPAPNDTANKLSSFYTAAWIMLLTQKYEDGGFQTRITEDATLRQILQWASRFSSQLRFVPDHPVEREQFLRHCLCEATLDIVMEGDAAADQARRASRPPMLAAQPFIDELCALWGDQFASLLRVGISNGGVPYQACTWLAASVYPPVSDWPPLVATLSLIFAGRASASTLSELSSHEGLEYFRCQRERVVGDIGFEEFPFWFTSDPSCIPQYIYGLLNLVEGRLSTDRQVRILVTPNVHIPDSIWKAQRKANQPTYLAILEQGLRRLSRIEELRMQPCSARDQLVAAHGQLFPTPEEVADNDKDRQRLADDYVKGLLHDFRAVCDHRDILLYYNRAAVNDELPPQTELDQYKNPIGAAFDLGCEKGFHGFRVLIGQLYTGEGFTKEKFASLAGKSLDEKGFQWHIETDENAFIRQLQEGINNPSQWYHVAWVISTPVCANPVELANVCERYHYAGGGLMIYADNMPFTAQANVILQRIFSAPRNVVDGNVFGNVNMARGADAIVNAGTRQTFAKHLVTTGIPNNLYEGITVSFLDESLRIPNLHVIGREDSAAAHAVMMVYEPEDPRVGRVAIDTGFTKLWENYETAGTPRYVNNSTVWLLSLDKRLSKSQPIDIFRPTRSDGEVAALIRARAPVASVAPSLSTYRR